MLLVPSDFDEAYAGKPQNLEPIPCQPPACFVNSYAPVAKPGADGPFFVNTYLLQPNRQKEVVGAVTVRSADFKCN
ncbi:hypothetical protein [Dishui Lake phycodnavirus 2]|nr:hypothetical protein [Dishui Lake phycodnavirus 2]